MKLRFSVLILAALWLGGCAGVPVLQPANERAFNFKADTFAFDNELVWVYEVDRETGVMRTRQRIPKPTYTHHCFVLARSARQFFQFARFDPARARVSDTDYRDLIRAVVALDPSETEPVPRIVIPGYRDLRSFSKAQESLLKEEMGGAVQSYLQRGNWRMVFPYSEGHRRQTAENLLAQARVQRPSILHLATFPLETINHAVVAFDAIEKDQEIRFRIYDPNDSFKETVLVFDRQQNRFYFPANSYFIGGHVDVYEVYRSLIF